MAPPARPAQFGVDEAGACEKLQDAVELAVHVSENEYRVRPGQVDSGTRRRLQPDFGPVEAIRPVRAVLDRDDRGLHAQPCLVCVTPRRPPLVHHPLVHERAHEPGSRFVREPADLQPGGVEPDVEPVFAPEAPRGLLRPGGRRDRRGRVPDRRPGAAQPSKPRRRHGASHKPRPAGSRIVPHHRHSRPRVQGISP